MPREWGHALRAAGADIQVIADGYDVLSPLQRWRLLRILRPQGRLIVTAHRPCSLPLLLETRTSVDLLTTLVEELFAASPNTGRPSDELLLRLFRRCGGNLREVFRNLYMSLSTDSVA